MTRRTILLSAASALWNQQATRWIAADITGRIREANWPAAEPVSFGSLLKPFLALTYLGTHSQAPVIKCGGAAAGCWYAPGHGQQDLVAALANSCNVYFLQLAGTLNRAALDLTCLSYGLALPPRSWPASRLIGLGPGWPQAPLAVVRAFATLARDASEPQRRTVLAGMLRCSKSGTGRAIRVLCYAKTGTAADGFVTAIYPVENPRVVLLFARRNTTGANAAGYITPLLARLG